MKSVGMAMALMAASVSSRRRVRTAGGAVGDERPQNAGVRAARAGRGLRLRQQRRRQARPTRTATASFRRCRSPTARSSPSNGRRAWTRRRAWRWPAASSTRPTSTSWSRSTPRRARSSPSTTRPARVPQRRRRRRAGQRLRVRFQHQHDLAARRRQAREVDRRSGAEVPQRPVRRGRQADRRGLGRARHVGSIVARRRTCSRSRSPTRRSATSATARRSAISTASSRSAMTSSSPTG